MSLDRLPEELLLIILRKLDLKSIHNLYDTGNCYIQTVICIKGVIKACDLSLSSMATAHLLRTKFFKNVCTFIQELDLKGIQDLTKTALMAAVKRMNNLLTLNVSYTNIHIFDFLDIYEQCPTIKNIAIDFQFHKTGVKDTEIPLEMLSKCRNVFANLENVQFVGSVENLLNSSTPLNLLINSNLNSLTFVLVKSDKLFTVCYTYMGYATITCRNFNVFNLCWRGSKRHLEPYIPSHHDPKLIKNLGSDYEYIYLCAEITAIDVECSPIFKSFFEDNFQIEPVVKPNFDKRVNRNSICMFWEKETTTFDTTFYEKLSKKLKPIFPCVRTSSDAEVKQLTNDWIWVRHTTTLENLEEKKFEPTFKKRRITNPNIILDYDNLFQDKEKLELSIQFLHHLQHPVTLSNSLNFLKKLTFLQLTGCVRYSSEFFNVLFRCCENLVTLDVEAPSVSPCMPAISRSVPLSSTLKNLRIVDRSIDFDVVFSSLAQCKTLENIIVNDLSNVRNDLGKPNTLFKQCKNLYYLCIEASMSETSRTNMLKVFNKIKLSCERWYLHIELITHERKYKYSYDPFVEVFKTFRFKVV